MGNGRVRKQTEDSEIQRLARAATYHSQEATYHSQEKGPREEVLDPEPWGQGQGYPEEPQLGGPQRGEEPWLLLPPASSAFQWPNPG